MNLMYRILIFLLCLVAAIACYGFGFQQGGIFFIALGVVFEALAWFGIFSRSKNSKS